MGETKKLDCLGEKCPVPVVKAKKAIDGAEKGDVIAVHVDNEVAVENLMKLAGSQQCACSQIQVAEKHYVVEITVGDRPEGAAAGISGGFQAEDCADCGALCEDAGGAAGAEKPYIVAVSSNTMGNGDDALGKILIKGFLYAVSQLDVLPETMLFYNGGVMLTTEGSDSLEDLKSLEEQGVKILSCGTCLDFYKRKELLKVGQVTDMYTIVETMARAGKILRP